VRLYLKFVSFRVEEKPVGAGYVAVQTQFKSDK